MSNKSATKSTIRYWIFLAIALSFFFAGMTISGIGFVFSPNHWLDSIIHGVIITLNTLNVVLVIPRLVSLAFYGKDVQILKDLF